MSSGIARHSADSLTHQHHLKMVIYLELVISGDRTPVIDLPIVLHNIIRNSVLECSATSLTLHATFMNMQSSDSCTLNQQNSRLHSPKGKWYGLLGSTIALFRTPCSVVMKIRRLIDGFLSSHSNNCTPSSIKLEERHKRTKDATGPNSCTIASCILS